jgi:hypothetical protein
MSKIRATNSGGVSFGIRGRRRSRGREAILPVALERVLGVVEMGAADSRHLAGPADVLQLMGQR